MTAESMDFLKVNQRVEMTVTGTQEKYFSRVEDVVNDGIVVAAPVKQGQVVAVAAGTLFNITILGENDMYNFQTEVLSRSQTGTVPVLTLKKPDSMQKVQRRNFFRVSADLSVGFRVLPEVTAMSMDPFIPARAKDISGGGLLLSTEQPIAREMVVELLVTIPQEKEQVPAVAKIVFVKEGKGGDKHREAATVFMVIDEPDREKIVKYVFKRQQELRRKELGRT